MQTVMVTLILTCLIKVSIQIEPWNLPVFPSPAPPKRLGNRTVDKNIPRHLWIAVRNLEDGLNYQQPALFERNSNWELHITSNDMKDEFMNTVFANTSLLWAYHIISPVAGAAKADLWRYAVLWAYGGAYVDDDSDIKTPLDKMIEPLDELIISYEKNGFNANRCYIPTYHLSDYSTFRNASKRNRHVFHDMCLLNWAIVSAPRHPIIAAVMENAVEIIRYEHFSDSVMRNLHAAYRWEAVMCATGPSLLTATARELILRDLPGLSYKLAATDFRDYGGKFKAVATPVKKDPKHYMNVMQNQKGAHLLSSYLPEPKVTAEVLKQWQGKAVQGQNGKEIFVIDQGKKRGIPNWDTFCAMNISMADVHVISDSRIALIEQGPSMPPLDFTGPYPPM